METNHMIPVILSGGSGSRLWPLSRKLYPKQFLALTGEHSLFQQTLQRLSFEGMQKPVVVCNLEHRFIVNEQLAQIGLDAQGMLLEPFGRNTAPAVAMAALQLLGEGRDELMLILPADHVIDDELALRKALELARVAAEEGEMVLFGIPANSPETGFGYIKAARGEDGDDLVPGAYRVMQFVEKPDAMRAAEFVRSGGYYWNSGMFLFRASRYLDELRAHEPDIYDTCVLALERSKLAGGALTIDAGTFECCPDNSIDYAVMEKTSRACVVPLAAGWNDVGSWSSLWDVHEKNSDGNVLKGDVVTHGSHNSFVHATSKLVTLVGMERRGGGGNQGRGDDRPQGRRTGRQEAGQQPGRQGPPGDPEPLRRVPPVGSYDSVDNGVRHQVKHITVKPGAQLSLQMHHHRAEHWIVVSGTAQVTCDDKVFLLTENQSTYIPIASVHRLANPGKIPLEIIEVQSGSYLGEDDIERLEDVYGRTPGKPVSVG